MRPATSHPVPLDGRTALITGGTTGIGYSIAESLSNAGAKLCLVARRSDLLNEAVSKLSEHNETVGVVGSVREGTVQEAAIRSCVERLGGLDILINNAGHAGTYGDLASVPWETVDDIWDTNQGAPLRLTVRAWHAAMKDRGGCVLNITSFAGLEPRPGHGAYGASKAALILLTKQFALEMAPRVRVNAIAPGLVETSMTEELIERVGRERAIRGRPLGRLGTPHDIAGAALFLVSDASSWITGQVLVVDGGACLR